MSKELLPHQQRIVDEKTELDLKIFNLQKFIESNTTTYDNLSSYEKGDLTQQLHMMELYSKILQRRINRF